MRRRHRRIASILLVLVLLVAFLPTLVSPFVPPRLERFLQPHFNGRVAVEGVRLRWLSGPVLRGVRVYDERGRLALEGDLRVGRSLARLLLGSRDLGTIRVEGVARPSADADGRWSLGRLVRASSASSTGGPARLPVGLAFTLRPDVALTTGSGDLALTGSMSLDAGGAIAANLVLGLTPASTRGAGPGTTVSISGDLAGLVRADRTLAPSSLSGSAVVEASGANSGRLMVRITDGSVVALPGARFELDTPFDWSTYLAGLPVRTRGVVLGVERLSLSIEDMLAGDLRSLDAALALACGEVEGAVGETLAWSLRDASARVTIGPSGVAFEAAGAARAAGRTAREGGGRPGAGEDPALAGSAFAPFVIAAHAERWLDAGGRPIGNPSGRFEGKVEGVEAALIGSLARGLPAWFDPSADLGPSLDLGVEGRFDGATRVEARATLAGANASGEAGFRLAEGVLASVEPGWSVRLRSVGPALSRALDGVAITSGGFVELIVADARVPIARAAAGDLRGSVARARLRAGASVGTLTEGGATREWRTSPIDVAIDATTSGEVGVEAAGQVKVDGEVLARLEADARVLGVLDAEGRASIPEAGEGTLELAGLSIARLRSIFDAGWIPEGLDDRLLVTVAASRGVEGGAPAGQADATSIRLRLSGSTLRGGGEFTLSDKALRGHGVHLEAGEAFLRPWAEALGRGAGAPRLTFEPGSPARGRLEVASFSLPIEHRRRPAFDRMFAEAELTLDSLGLSRATGGGSLIVRDARVALRTGPSREPSLTIGARVEGTGGAAEASGSLTITDSRREGELDLASARLEGSLALRGVTPSMLSTVLGGSVDPGLVRDALAGPIDLTLSLTPGERGSTLVECAVRGEAVNGSVLIVHEIESVRLGANSIALTPSPALAERLGATLVDEPRIDLSAEPLRVAKRAPGPGVASLARGLDLSTSVLSLSASVPGRLLFAPPSVGEPARAPPSTTGDGERVGARRIGVRVGLPLDRSRGPVEFTASGLLATRSRDAGEFRATGALAPASPGPARVEATLSLAGVESAVLGSMLEDPHAFASGVGERFDAEMTLEHAGEGAGADGEARGGRTRATVSIVSPLVRTLVPARLTVLQERLALAEPFEVEWTMTPEWANRHAIGAALHDTPRGPGTGAHVYLDSRAQVRARVGRLVLSRPTESTGLFLPGVFRVGGEVTSPSIVLELDQGVRASLRDVALAVWTIDDEDRVGFRLQADALDAGAAASPRGSVLAAGRAGGFADERGRPAHASARLEARAELEGVPTTIVDALAGQRGLLVEALGPSVRVDARGEELSIDSGRVRASATSDRAAISVAGRVEGDRFFAEEEARASLSAISPELARRMVGSLGLFGRLEKRAEDGPGIVSATNLSVPLNADLHALGGTIVVDPGTARFETNPLLAGLLRATNQRSEGMIGRRLEPLTLHVREGEVSFERYVVPVGEYSLTFEGRVDIADGTMDLVTRIPFGALTDTAAGDLNVGLGRTLGWSVPLVNDLTMVPFRTRGEIGRATPQPDFELLARDLGESLMQNTQAILEGIGDLFRAR